MSEHCETVKLSSLQDNEILVDESGESIHPVAVVKAGLIDGNRHFVQCKWFTASAEDFRKEKPVEIDIAIANGENEGRA